MTTFVRNNGQDVQPGIDLDDEYDYPPAFDLVSQGDFSSKQDAQKDAHDRLLSYLLSRLDSDTNRNSRLLRFARMDRIISTWQKLSKEDSKRQEKQDATGKAQAISMNLPVTHTHVDDMVSFFAEVYSPTQGSYFATPPSDIKEFATELMERMNEDARASGFYTELTKTLRALMKYNQGGIHLEWVTDAVDANDDDKEQGINWSHSIDNYNLLWDQAVPDPSQIRTKAEWAAVAQIVNRMELVRGELALDYYGVGCVVDAYDGSTSLNAFGSTQATYYRYPPIHSGVNATDDSTAETSVDWEAYGKSLGNAKTEIKNAYERVDMYCWLNPADFGLSLNGKKYDTPGYYLWRFQILNGERIIAAKPMNPESTDLPDQRSMTIPMYIGFLNVDDMLGAERSIAELLAPFQGFMSFMFNAQIAGARSSIYGMKFFDPMMFDPSSMEASDGLTGIFQSKVPGRDVRTGIAEVKGTYDGSKTLNQVGDVLNLLQAFFPSQALPSQVANMDRAIESQVAAVLQGTNRRLHMLVKLCDENIFSNFRFDQYRNLKAHDAIPSAEVSDRKIRALIGSGLEQLNRETAENAIRQLLFAMIQNANITQQYDVSAVFDFWGSMLKVPINTGQFKLKPQEAPPGTGTPGAAPAAGAVATPPVAPTIVP